MLTVAKCSTYASTVSELRYKTGCDALDFYSSSQIQEKTCFSETRYSAVCDSVEMLTRVYPLE